ncbi:MAG: NAD(P)/FAD-dependent oxidoreductase [Eubacterium sp.]|nr:NAD(P)/FAD-dependent oxidoreductase [Eubacterium sp.]
MPPDDVIVIGAGAAGLMAAISAARAGANVILIEKNEKTGKKLYITGKGRCNFTNSCDTEDVFPQVVTNAKFLYSCIYGFTNHDVTEWFEGNGLRVKEERGGRMFPNSDKSSDVIKTLNNVCKKENIRILLNTRVSSVITEGTSDVPVRKKACGVILENGENLFSKAVIIATGGISYPSTGSTGDGYRFAEECSHTITALRPGLTGMNTFDEDIFSMQGLTLNNVSQTIWDGAESKPKKLYSGFGELLFTHFGVSGPVILSASSIIGDRLEDSRLILKLDIKPALDNKELDNRLLREIGQTPARSVSNMLRRLLPASMIPVVLDRAGLDGGLRCLDLTKKNRQSLILQMKEFTIRLRSLRSFSEAIITRGGVNVREIDPHTMESRLCEGLFFAGEVMDVDALTGGYNLQIAWSTGHTAGMSAAKRYGGRIESDSD